MLPLLHFCASAANIRKIIFVYQSQKTVAYFMQIMRPATDVAYELRFYDVPVAYLFCIHSLCVAYMLRCCGKSFLCVTYLYCVSLWLLVVKIHSKRTVPIAYQAIKLRTRYLPAAFNTFDRTAYV